MDKSSDQRSSKAKAYHWASKIISICLVMIVPCILGVWIDDRLGWTPVLTIVGLALGMYLGVSGLLGLIKISQVASSSNSQSDDGNH